MGLARLRALRIPDFKLLSGPQENQPEDFFAVLSLAPPEGVTGMKRKLASVHSGHVLSQAHERLAPSPREVSAVVT